MVKPMLRARRLAFKHALKLEGIGATYTQGETELTFNVIVTRADAETIPLVSGASAAIERFDVLCAHDALIDDEDNFVKPKHGDTIVLDDERELLVWKPSMDGEAWRWSDGTHSQVRIFCKVSN